MRGHLGERRGWQWPRCSAGNYVRGFRDWPPLIEFISKKGRKNRRRRKEGCCHPVTRSPLLFHLSPQWLIHSLFGLLLIHFFHHIYSPRLFLLAPSLRPWLIGSPATFPASVFSPFILSLSPASTFRVPSLHFSLSGILWNIHFLKGCLSLRYSSMSLSGPHFGSSSSFFSSNPFCSYHHLSSATPFMLVLSKWSCLPGRCCAGAQCTADVTNDFEEARLCCSLVSLRLQLDFRALLWHQKAYESRHLGATCHSLCCLYFVPFASTAAPPPPTPISGGSIHSHRRPLLISSISPSLLFHPSITPRLLKSAAIKTDAGLKCHGCISNCQNINLFTPSCPASFSFFSGLRGEKKEAESWKKGAGAEWGGRGNGEVRERKGDGGVELLAGGGVSCHLFWSCRRQRWRDLTT